MAAKPDDLLGRTIAGKFRIEELIGGGAMGAVYRARQVALEKTVAIKVMHREHADDAMFAARFHREAKAASRLNHPNSVQVLDFGEDSGGLLYIAMEHLDGRSLHRVLHDDAPLPAVRIAEILMQVCAALAVAHDMGVVHRDLKPENIVVLQGVDDDGRSKDVVKVCDFGIAKIIDSRAYGPGDQHASGAALTTGGLVVGTPEYMSPEQGRGEKLDPRSDLYSVGVILFEMLTGRVPFTAESALGVLLRHVTEAPALPSSLAAGVEPRLEAICLRALSKSRDDRYATARELRLDLRHVLGGDRSAASGPELPTVVRTAQPASGQARTMIATPLELASLGSAPDLGVKPTLSGTASPLARPSRGRVAIVAVVAVTAGVAVTGLALRRAPAPAAVAQAALPPPETTLVPESLSGTEVPPLEEPNAGVGEPDGAPNRASHGAAPRPGGRAAALVATAAPGASVSAAVSASASAAVLPAPAPSAPSAPPPDPDFDPARAYVEVGLINAQGVRERAVRAALHGVGFAGCFKQALIARGARAVGTATLDLSIDENGVTRSAVASGAEFIPGLTRCVQGAAMSTAIPKSQVDPGGGTAEVTLAFRLP